MAAPTTSNNPRRRGTELGTYFFSILVLFGVLTFAISQFHGSPSSTTGMDLSSIEAYLRESIKSVSGQVEQQPEKRYRNNKKGLVLNKGDLRKGGIKKVNRLKKNKKVVDKEKRNEKKMVNEEKKEKGAVNREGDGGEGEDSFNLAGLSCDRFGGPSYEKAQEMVYWRDIPQDNRYVSPLKKKGNVAEYLTFEPDEGGWNNIRMAMETVLALAFAMGRTLVLPPEKQLYLIGQEKGKAGKKQRNKFSFNHFFHMEAIHKEHPGLDIITMDEFLQREAMKGHFRDKDGNVAFPPGNRTNWDGQPDPIFKWLRSVAHVAIWNPQDCLAAFPASSTHEDVQELLAMNETIHQKVPHYQDFVGKPVPVDAPAIDRMKESWADRQRLCIYDEEMQAAPLIHMPVDFKLEARLLVHFYAFLFFQDWHQDLWMKRFVRDHVRYVDEIQCAAARVVEAVRNHARNRDPNKNPDGAFDTMHVRRGDFQYKPTRIEAVDIYKQTKRQIPENSTVFIATDERNKAFFDPLKRHYDIVFLDDFHDVIANVNTNYYGMIDQLVSSRGRYFFGCWFSTFTGYINRLRGYHANNDKTPGYEQGVIPSWYYVLADRFDHMQTYYPVKKSFWAREFPTSWRLIETGMSDLHSKLSSS